MIVCMPSRFSHVQLCDAMDCSLPGSFIHGGSPGKNTRVGCHALLQGIFPTQGMNPCLFWLLHCWWILYHWATWEAPYIMIRYLYLNVCMHYGYKVYKEIAVKRESVSCSVMYDSLLPHGLKHTSFPCPSSFPRAYSNFCPLSHWCHPVILSSVNTFSSCLQSFPPWGSFALS